MLSAPAVPLRGATPRAPRAARSAPRRAMRVRAAGGPAGAWLPHRGARGAFTSPPLGTHRLTRRRAPRRCAGGPPPAREPWDLARFARTVLFFNPPPGFLAAPLRALGLTGPDDGAARPPAATAAATATPTLLRLDGSRVAPGARRDVVLVAGATGGVGSRVVRQLLAEGVAVRALVRDLAKARAVLGAADAAAPGLLELALVDLAQPATLGGAAGALGARCVGAVWAAAPTVAPKEGDTAARDKYRQGIKFYDPEVVGDTPEAVEARGAAHLLAAVAPALRARAQPAAAAAAASPPLPVFFDAAAPPGAGGPAWGPLDDVVMGGASASALSLSPGGGEGGAPAGVFAGRISTANAGGFASVRSRDFAPPVDARAAAGLALRLRGDGQRYKLFLRTSPGWDAMAYGASFDTAPGGAWQTVRLPFAAFAPIFRARTVRDAPPLDAGCIRSLQLMLSKFEYDGQLNPRFAGDGAFALPIARIAAYSAADVAAEAAPASADASPAAAPLWVHVSSAGVTRPDRPGVDLAAEPPAVRMNDALGGLLTHKLAGEDAVRSSGVPFAVVRPVALTEEPPGAELEVGQGDVMRGKISRDDVAELCVALLRGRGGAAAAGATFEVKSTVPFSTPWEGPPGGGAPQRRDWAALLAALRPGVTGKTVRGVYSGTRPEAEVAAEASAAAARAA
jgi:hypothetical protein